MKRTFVDTSALYPLDEDDRIHASAAALMTSAGAELDRLLVTHSFITVEAAALVHRRLGTDAVRVLLDAWLPALSVFHVDETLYDAGTVAYRAGLGRGTSFVDHVSFEFMGMNDITECFGFDDDFTDADFTVIPSS